MGVSRLLTWSVLYWQQKYFVVGLIARTWNDITPEPYAGSAVLSFLIGIVAPFAVNRFISRQTAKDWALKGSTDDLAKLLHSAMKRELPVSISLDTRKFYIAYILRSPNLDPEEKNIVILPLASGYRDKTALTFRFTTDYTPAYKAKPEHITEEDFQIVIPVSSVKSAHIFDPKVYADAFSKKQTGNRFEDSFDDD